jgi:hypothetical protein
MVEYDFGVLLQVLQGAEVEFLVVGGLSAVLNGVNISTFDLDVVHHRTEENVDRILAVLERLDAVYRSQPERRLRPVKTSLLSAGHSNLMTKFGPLDLLRTIGDNLDYEELLPNSTELMIAEGVRARVLNLEMLIEIKEKLGGEKDRAMLPLLRRTLDEKSRKGTTSS